MPKQQKKTGYSRPSAHHPNARKIPDGALTKDEALKYLGVALQTLDYYIKQGIVDTYRSGKYRYITLESCERLRSLNSPIVEDVGEKWLTTREASELTGLTIPVIVKKCRSGEFESAKGLHRLFVNPASVKAYNDRYKYVNGHRTVTVNEAAKIYGCTLHTMRIHAYGANSPIKGVWKDNRRLLYLDSLNDFIKYQQERRKSNWKLPPKPPANNKSNDPPTFAQRLSEASATLENSSDFSDFQIASDFSDFEKD